MSQPLKVEARHPSWRCRAGVTAPVTSGVGQSFPCSLRLANIFAMISGVSGGGT